MQMKQPPRLLGTKPNAGKYEYCVKCKKIGNVLNPPAVTVNMATIRVTIPKSDHSGNDFRGLHGGVASLDFGLSDLKQVFATSR